LAQSPQRWGLQTARTSRRAALRADRSLFYTSGCLVKANPPAIYDRGEAVTLFAMTIRQRVENRSRSAFHNSELCERDIGCLVKSALTGATSLRAG
jgi:hypothetical protein